MSYWTIEEQDIGDGERDEVWVERSYRLPRISEHLLNLAVYLYTSKPAAEGGVKNGGSGFLVAVPAGSAEPLAETPFPTPGGGASIPGRQDVQAPFPRGHFHLYAVTNRHVARDCPYIRVTKRDLTSKVLHAEHWFKHRTSDLAVCPIAWNRSWGNSYLYAAVTINDFLSQEEMRGFDVGIGDDTFCIGRFITHDGRQRNLPVARFGPISSLPIEPIEVEGEGEQNCFLIESRIIQGYSGSPVFLNIPPWELREYSMDTLRRQLGERLYDSRNTGEVSGLVRLLGVVTSFLPEDDLNPKISNTGMMAVVPAWELLELLNLDKLRELRKKELEKWQREGPLDGRGGVPA